MKTKISIYLRGDKKAMQKFYENLINDTTMINLQTYKDTSDYRYGGYNEINVIVTKTNIEEIK